MTNRIKFIFSWAIIFIIATLTIVLATDIIISNTNPDAKSYYLRARTYYHVINSSKTFLENIISDINNLVVDIKQPEVTKRTNDNLDVKYTIYPNNDNTQFSHTYVVWTKKVSETNFMRAVEASFNEERTHIFIKAVPSFLINKEISWQNLVIQGEFDLTNNTAEIFISHSTETNPTTGLEMTDVPPYIGFRARYDGDIMEGTGIAYYPGDIKEVGYIDPGISTPLGNTSSLASYSFKTVFRLSRTTDVTYVAGVLINDGTNGISTLLDTTLPTDNIPEGEGNGVYLGHAFLIGQEKDKLPQILLDTSEAYDDYYKNYSQLTDIDNIEVISTKEVYRTCRANSIYRYKKDNEGYIFENLDGLGDTPNF